MTQGRKVGYTMLFPYVQCASETHSFDKGRTKRLNESPTLSVGPPKEDTRTLVYKTQGKSLVTMIIMFGIFIRALQLATFKPLYMLNSTQRPNLTGYPFTYVDSENMPSF